MGCALQLQSHSVLYIECYEGCLVSGVDGLQGLNKGFSLEKLKYHTVASLVTT